MRKVIMPLLVLAAVSCIIPTYAACSNDTAEVITGGACSIKDLNRNLEKQKAGSQVSVTKPQRNLRPVRNQPDTLKSDDCVFGMCLFRTLLNEMPTGE